MATVIPFRPGGGSILPISMEMQAGSVPVLSLVDCCFINGQTAVVDCNFVPVPADTPALGWVSPFVLLGLGDGSTMGAYCEVVDDLAGTFDVTWTIYASNPVGLLAPLTMGGVTEVVTGTAAASGTARVSCSWTSDGSVNLELQIDGVAVSRCSAANILDHLGSCVLNSSPCYPRTEADNLMTPGLTQLAISNTGINVWSLTINDGPAIGLLTDAARPGLPSGALYNALSPDSACNPPTPYPWKWAMPRWSFLDGVDRFTLPIPPTALLAAATVVIGPGIKATIPINTTPIDVRCPDVLVALAQLETTLVTLRDRHGSSTPFVVKSDSVNAVSLHTPLAQPGFQTTFDVTRAGFGLADTISPVAVTAFTVECGVLPLGPPVLLGAVGGG